jgi:6-phosphogluconolactonase (cycloisomerase 2 family)
MEAITRPRRAVPAALLSILLAGGCGDSGTESSSPSRATATLYVVHQSVREETSRLSGYQIDLGTGRLTPVPGSPYALPAQDRLHDVVVDPSDRYVYVSTNPWPASSGEPRRTAGLHAFARDPATGGLTPLAGSPFTTTPAVDYRSPAFDGAGSYLYVSEPAGEVIVAFRFDAASGALRPLEGRGFFPAANNVNGVAASPSARFLYATARFIVSTQDPFRGYVLAYAVEANGALTRLGEPVPAGKTTGVPVMHPSGRHLYAPNADSNDVSGYAIDAGSGALAPLTGSPFSSGVGTIALAVTPSGSYLYALNGRESSVSSFAVEAATGALRPLGPAVPAIGNTLGAMAVAPGGRFLYVAGRDTGIVSSYAVDTAAGLLRALPEPVSTAPRPWSLATTHAQP